MVEVPVLLISPVRAPSGAVPHPLRGAVIQALLQEVHRVVFHAVPEALRDADKLKVK